MQQQHKCTLQQLYVDVVTRPGWIHSKEYQIAYFTLDGSAIVFLYLPDNATQRNFANACRRINNKETLQFAQHKCGYNGRAYVRENTKQAPSLDGALEFVLHYKVR